MSRLIERAEDITAEVNAHLVAAGIDDATVTTDLLKVPAALANGPVVVVQPPKLKYITAYGDADATWELFVIAGPTFDRLAAWARIDGIMDALATPMNLTDAEPATFQHPGMADHAAYVLTFPDTL